MATSLFGSCGAKVAKLDLEPGMAVLGYTAENTCLFGVVMATTQPRHYAVSVISEIGIDVGLVGGTHVIRVARNDKEMISQFPSVIPVAAIHIVTDVLEVWWAPEDDAQIALQERMELVRSVSGFGSRGSVAAGPPAQVQRMWLNPIR